MSNYEKGKIYRLSNKVNEKFYIGSTTEDLNKRKSKFPGHMQKRPGSKLACEITAVGWKNGDGGSNWIIEELESCPCGSKGELETREGWWQRKFFEESPELILNQRQEGDTKFVVQQRASKKFRETHSDAVSV